MLISLSSSSSSPPSPPLTFLRSRKWVVDFFSPTPPPTHPVHPTSRGWHLVNCRQIRQIRTQNIHLSLAAIGAHWSWNCVLFIAYTGMTTAGHLVRAAVSCPGDSATSLNPLPPPPPPPPPKKKMKNENEKNQLNVVRCSF